MPLRQFISDLPVSGSAASSAGNLHVKHAQVFSMRCATLRPMLAQRADAPASKMWLEGAQHRDSGGRIGTEDALAP